MSYPVPASQVEIFHEIKKSKFIACAAYAHSRESAMTLLEEVKRQYPDARHHCWAYLFGNPASPFSAAMSDDGEPSGTAGKPILNVLQHKNIGDIMVIVTRYFGGVKLGAGGLVRAYSASAQQAIDSLEVREEVKLIALYLETDFKHEQFVRHMTSSASGAVVQCDYSHLVAMRIKLPLDQVVEFQQHMAPITSELKLLD
ncbi:IMPACT family protein [Alteromonas sp. D210916BOD_24]|uniref:YigZ family protein n=1 Tax=Alteromonas sp. D210916BOD_24 TaxID=3157618 RepID=UPI00399D1C0F